MTQGTAEFHFCVADNAFNRLHMLTLERNISTSEVIRRGAEMLMYIADEELLFGATLMLARTRGARSPFSVFRLPIKNPPIHEVRVWCCHNAPFAHRMVLTLPNEVVVRLQASSLAATYSVSQLVSMGYLLALFVHLEEARGTRFFLTYDNAADLEIFPL